MDYGDLIVHIMDESTRSFYNLEGLWQKGRELELPPEAPAPASTFTNKVEG